MHGARRASWRAGRTSSQSQRQPCATHLALVAVVNTIITPVPIHIHIPIPIPPFLLYALYSLFVIASIVGNGTPFDRTRQVFVALLV